MTQKKSCNSEQVKGLSNEFLTAQRFFLRPSPNGLFREAKRPAGLLEREVGKSVTCQVDPLVNLPLALAEQLCDPDDVQQGIGALDLEDPGHELFDHPFGNGFNILGFQIKVHDGCLVDVRYLVREMSLYSYYVKTPPLGDKLF